MIQFEQQLNLPRPYQDRVARVIRESQEKVLSQASVALYVSGILLHLHAADDPLMAFFEKTPEYLSLAMRVQEAAIGDTLKVMRHQSKPFFGVIIDKESSILFYQEEGKERGCTIDRLENIAEQLKPFEIRIYRRKCIEEEFCIKRQGFH